MLLWSGLKSARSLTYLTSRANHNQETKGNSTLPLTFLSRLASHGAAIASKQSNKWKLKSLNVRRSHLEGNAPKLISNMGTNRATATWVCRHIVPKTKEQLAAEGCIDEEDKPQCGRIEEAICRVKNIFQPKDPNKWNIKLKICCVREQLLTRNAGD